MLHFSAIILESRLPGEITHGKVFTREKAKQYRISTE
jgi:hypothetical protein